MFLSTCRSFSFPFLNVSSSDSLLISVAGMAVYTGYVFMPQHIMAILHYFEVVQWHDDSVRPSTGLVSLCPSVSPRLEVGIFSNHAESELFPKVNLLWKVNSWRRSCETWTLRLRTVSVNIWRRTKRKCFVFYPLHLIWLCDVTGLFFFFISFRHLIVVFPQRLMDRKLGTFPPWVISDY